MNISPKRVTTKLVKTQEMAHTNDVSKRELKKDGKTRSTGTLHCQALGETMEKKLHNDGNEGQDGRGAGKEELQ